MSKTIRRKNSISCRKSWMNLNWFIMDWDKPAIGFYHVLFERGSKGYKKGKAKFHSDSGTTTHKEPGPSWWRNLTCERPLRRKHKNEIRKVVLNPEYEPDIIEKGKLEYWT